MAKVVYLQTGEPAPKVADDEPWLLIEPFDNDGKFYGTGASRKENGEWVSYASLAEKDVNLASAIAAALEWAEKYRVPTIYVRTTPANPCN